MTFGVNSTSILDQSSLPEGFQMVSETSFLHMFMMVSETSFDEPNRGDLICCTLFSTSFFKTTFATFHVNN